MCAAGFYRKQGACHFVFALGAAFKSLIPVVDAPFQWLVVTGFKVQAIDSFECAPITPIGHGVIANCDQARCD